MERRGNLAVALDELGSALAKTASALADHVEAGLPLGPYQNVAAPLEVDRDPALSRAQGQNLLLTTQQAAELLGVAVATLNTKRFQGGGPPFIKLGKRVYYPREDLVAWVAAKPRYTNTIYD